MDLSLLKNYNYLFPDISILFDLRFLILGNWRLINYFSHEISNRDWNKMKQNKDVGFKLKYSIIDNHFTTKIGIYAFTLSQNSLEKIVYIGKTESSINERLKQYTNASNSTSKRIKILIKNAIKNGFVCNIFFLPLKNELPIQYFIKKCLRTFPSDKNVESHPLYFDIINILEISLIKELNPIWNKQFNPIFDDKKIIMNNRIGTVCIPEFYKDLIRLKDYYNHIEKKGSKRIIIRKD